MTTITAKLAAALRDTLDVIKTVAECAEYEAHNITSCHDPKPARDALAEHYATPAEPDALTDADNATILAALRYWQRDMEQALHDDREDWTVTLRGDGHFQEHAPLSVEEIDVLCDRINGGQ